MKNAQIKSAFVFALMMLFSVALAYGLSVTINSPDDEWSLDNNVKINFTPDSEKSSFTVLNWCAIQTNKTGTFVTSANYTNVPSATPFVRGVGMGDSIGQNYVWRAQCYNGSAVVTSSNASFGVDGSVTSVTLDSPSDGSYQSTQDPIVAYTPTDSANLDACVLYHNISGTWQANQTNASVVSGVSHVVNFSSYNVSVPGDGRYMWNVVCNDTAGHIAWAEDTNRTLVIDTTNPSVISIANTNNTYGDNPFLNVSWNQTTETNFDYYLVSVASDSAMSTVFQTVKISSRANSTEIGRLPSVGTYYVMVGAYDKVGRSTNTTLGYTYETASASFTYAPLTGTYTSDSIPTFNVTVVDDNPDFCSLYLSVLDNRTDAVFNRSIGVTNNTLANFSVEGLSDGVYSWNIECNDTNNVKLNVSDSLLLTTIDTTAPTEPYLLINWGMTNNTDKTPTLSWAATTETNFDYYAVLARYTNNASKAYETNVFAKATTSVDVVLPVKGTYNFTVTAYDLAGNSDASTNTTVQTSYYVDDVCGTLVAGWNVCGATWATGKNLSVIGVETSATFVTVWNTSNHVWATCSVGVSLANCGLKVGINNDDAHAVWVYVNESTEWNNRTWTAQNNNANITLYNTTNGIGWNLEAGFFRNGRTFGDLGRNFDVDNVSMLSLNYNNGSSASYVNVDPYTNMSVNATSVGFGRALWVYYDNPVGSSMFDVGSW